MKNFIIGLIILFFSSAVYAESYLVYYVTDNTRVVINDAPCVVPGLHGKRAVVQRADGAYIRGCWEKVDSGKHVKITWNNPAIPNDFSVLRLVEFHSVTE